MSYDVNVTMNNETVAEFNHTSNTAPMMIEAGLVLRNLDNVSCREALPIISNTINTIVLDQERFKPMEAANGCGTINTTIIFLKDIENACRENIDGEIIVT